MLKKFLLIIIIISSFIIPVFAFAHQPRIVEQKVTEIKNPEVSQAFYGELKGGEHHFVVDSKEDLELYASILVPDVPGIDKDVSVEIYTKEKEAEVLLFILDGVNYQWQPFYEEFAGDHYFEGPDILERVGAGTYFIRVSSPDNLGKYVLVVGKQEKFPLEEIINTIILLPELKIFFERSPLAAYFNRVGLMLLGFLVVLIIFIFVVIKIIKWLIKKKRRLA